MDEDFDFNADDALDLPDAEAMEVASPEPSAGSRDDLMRTVHPEGERGLRAELNEVLVGPGGACVIAGVSLASGPENGCPVERLVRVEIAGQPQLGSRLAEPWPTAVIEAVLSLLRGGG